MKTKILFLHAGAEMYGADKVLLELLNGLDKEMFEPIVLLPTEGPLVKELNSIGIEVHVMDYPILRRKIFNPKGIIKYFIQYIKYSHKIMKFMKKQNISLVHVNTTAVLEGLYLKLLFKKKFIWHVHEIIVSPKIVYKVTSYLLNFSNQIVTVSNSTKQHLLDSGVLKNKDIQVIYNGVNNEIYHPNHNVKYLYKEFDIPENALIVGNIGRINSWKGQKDFVRALAPVLKKHENVYALIVGGVFESETHFLEELKLEVEKSGAQEKIRISDFRDDVAVVHDFIDIFVLPSTNPDPLPTVVLESMASRNPIIGYAHGGVTEMVKQNENGILVEPLDTELLGDAVESLIIESSKLQNMGSASLIRQKKFFSLDSYILNFSKLYKQVESKK